MERYYDPEDRIREKQQARNLVDADLASGRAGAAEINVRNNFFVGLDVRNAEIEEPLK